MFWHISVGCKATVGNLLVTTGIIQLNQLDQRGIIEIRNRRIVKRDVAILADSHADEVYWFLGQQRTVAAAYRRSIGFFGGQRVKCFHADVAKQMRLEILSKALRMRAGQTHVIVHVKRRDSRPINRRLCFLRHT